MSVSESETKAHTAYPILHIEHFCPFSRRALLAASELGMTFSVAEAPSGTPPEYWSHLDASGCPPILELKPGTTLCGATPIGEYLEEITFDFPSRNRYSRNQGRDSSLLPLRLFPGTPRHRAEIRRLVQWFDEKFALDVTIPYLEERFRRHALARHHHDMTASLASPDPAVLRQCHAVLQSHMSYFEALLSERESSWLVGETLSMADLAAAAHFSCLDYFGMIPWSGQLKHWYLRIKCRPPFRFILMQRLPGLHPARCYDALDF